MRLLLSRVSSFGRRLFTTPTGILTLGGVAAVNYGLQEQFGTAQDFFHHEFTTTKDPDAVQDFYSTEDFLQILGIFPLAIHFVLAGVEWDTDTENSMDVWNSMQISFDITERENDQGEVSLFNKRERFKNYVPLIKHIFPILLWDQVQDYGFERMPDGKIKVQHHGESFYGPWPVRLLVQAHAYYVIWATERHINSPIFGSEDLEAQEHQRSNIPLHAVKEFFTALRIQQEQHIEKSRLAGKPTMDLEANLSNLKRMETIQPAISLQRRGSHLRLKVEDPQAQALVRAALEEVSKVDGSQAAISALQQLLANAESEAELRPTQTNTTTT